ncbi:MAG TPA: fumarylacetoacetate hydrolase family protein [Ilumatobacter sp.]|nr:fumarylacetoacetate hydrolase family protein [Ilumatobacter sp.]
MNDGAVVVAHVDDDGYRPFADDSPGALLRALVERPAPGADLVPAPEVRVLSPVVDPPSIRDFMIFEEHVVNSRVGSGTAVPPVWYQVPLFYFTNPASVHGPDEQVAVPRGARALDFELEVACLVGAPAADLDPDDPAACDVIAGFTLMNDWSARDLQMAEMDGGLGPAKGKDFATSFGPWVVTPDELDVVTPGRWACPLSVSVNGRRIGGGDLAAAHFSWSQVLSRASANTRLRAGDVIGSGTVGTGCLLELRALGPKADYPWLRAGDRVELDGGPLGTLANTIIDPATA